MASKIELRVSIRGRRLNGQAERRGHKFLCRTNINGIWADTELRLKHRDMSILWAAVVSDRKKGRLPGLSFRKHPVVLELESDFIRCLSAITEHEVVHALMRPEAKWRQHHRAMEHMGIVLWIC